MRITHLDRFLVLALLVVLAAAVPVAVQAAPRSTHDDGSPSVFHRAWDWISSLWGAGSGSFEPGGRSPSPPPTLVEESRVPAANDSRLESRLEIGRSARVLRRR